MPTKLQNHLLLWSITTTLSLPLLPAQESTPPAAAAPPVLQAPAGPGHVVRRYPQDRDVAVAIVGERPITLGELVDHLDAVHHPGFREALGKEPSVQRMLQSDLVAPWVRHYADLQALKLLTKDEAIDQEKLKQAQSDQLKRSFQGFLDQYVAQRRAQGRPAELEQKQVNRLLADFQLRSGLACELQGMLDFLEPDDYQRGAMQQFFNNNARAFGGRVKISHILIPNRDQGTGILLDEAGLGKAATLLADVRARLRPDGSNFDEVARLCSADGKTAEKGGLLGDVHRFDDRLPAVLCRAAWQLRDGEVSDVVESQYGWHLVKRLEFQQNIFILFTDDAIPSIREVMRRSRQEDLLFTARAKAAVKLLL